MGISNPCQKCIVRTMCKDNNCEDVYNYLTIKIPGISFKSRPKKLISNCLRESMLNKEVLEISIRMFDYSIRAYRHIAIEKGEVIDFMITKTPINLPLNNKGLIYSYCISRGHYLRVGAPREFENEELDDMLGLDVMCHFI